MKLDAEPPGEEGPLAEEVAALAEWEPRAGEVGAPSPASPALFCEDMRRTLATGIWMVGIEGEEAALGMVTEPVEVEREPCDSRLEDKRRFSGGGVGPLTTRNLELGGGMVTGNSLEAEEERRRCGEATGDPLP